MRGSADSGPAQPQRSPSYQGLLVGLLSINFGVVFFDRNALNFLMPFIQPELGFSNMAVGALASALSLSWALSGFIIGRLSDRLGRRKLLLIIATISFSLASVLSGLAQGFFTLMAARLLMGVAEGGVMPISQSLIVEQVTPARRGLAQGVMQNFGANLFGNFLGPIVLIGFAATFGWRSAFFLAAVPGLALALVMLVLIREEPRSLPERGAGDEALRQVLGNYNVRLCALIALLLVAYLTLFYTFMPVYLTGKGLSPQHMGNLMAVSGFGAMVAAFVVPGLSDRYGRRTMLLVAMLLGAILPFAGLFGDMHGYGIFVMFALGSAVTASFPLFMATIPAESVPPLQMATAMGFVVAFGEIIGGVGSPLIAGMMGDALGLASVLYVMLALLLMAAGLTFMMRETAPSRKLAVATV